MKTAKKFIAFAISAAMTTAMLPVMSVSAATNTAPTAPAGLITNELENPLNVEEPTFGWLVNDADENEIQTAYQIIVTDEVTDTEVWNSGKVTSSEQSYVPCGGTLDAGHPYSWKVKTWDKDGADSPYSESAYFSTGLNATEWAKAAWISDGTTGAEKAEGTYNHYWYVRTNKALTKTVKAATAYFSGVHDYDLYVNGTEIGRGQSFDYSSEARYQGWDIIDAVNSNTDSVTIGALVRTYGGGQGRAPGNAAFIGYVKLYYTDGTSDIITTNTTDWKISKTTPYREINSSSASGTRNGEGDFVEVYTASNAKNFTDPSFDATSWTAASERVSGTKATYTSKGTTVEIDDGIITDTPIAELSKVTAYIVEPKEIKVVNGKTIADFGVVIPARPEITFKNGSANRAVTITGGYLLNSDGTVAEGDKPQQSTTMTWTYNQVAGEQTYHAWDHLGFRYLQISDCGETFTKETLRAKVVHTNVPDGRQSTIVTSNETLNSVYTLMQRSSLYGIQNEFVDTPTREKGQFTDDARNISEASMATQFEREATRKAIMQFLASADRFWNENGTLLGRVNSVYPNVEGGRDIPEYSVNIPQWIWNYYMQTGDIATLEDAYPYMRATANYITKYTSSTTGLVERLAGGDTNPNDYQYGIVDWPASGRFGYDWKNTQKGAFATVNMLSKHAYDVIALAAEELAADMGNDRELSKIDYDIIDMRQRSADLKAAINSKLFNASKGLYCDGTTDTSGTQSSHISQHANSYALAFDIVEDENKETVAEYVASQGMRQGPMTADILAKGLFNGGQDAAALKLFVNENDYGWARTLKQGGSFTWESWVADGATVNDSQSHAWGATAASDILRNFAGVQILEAGAKRVRIAPVYVDLTSMNATVQTERGGVGVSYMRTEPTEEHPEIENSYSITLTIPANMTADIELPNIGDGTYKAGSKTGAAVENSFTLGSGTYTYVFDGEIIPPEKLDTKIYDEEVYDFKTLPSDAAGDYVYNDYITLHFGEYGAVSSADGFNMYKDGTDNAYLIFTPEADGTVEITGKVRGNASTLYVTETENSAKMGSTTDAAVLRSAGKDSSTTGMGSMKVEAGHTYYFYNTGGTSTGNPTSITTFTYTHEHVPVIGITGSADTANKLYTWTIGNEDEENTDNVYTHIDKYASITVGINASDTMSEDSGIQFTATAAPESGGVDSTGRYIILESKCSGTFSITYTCTGSNNRLYYYDFGTNDVSLSTCSKANGKVAQNGVANGAQTTTTIDMTAGNKYVIYPYTYNGGCNITALSYTYTAEPSDDTPTEPTDEPDLPKEEEIVTPISEDGDAIIILSEETVSDGKVNYAVKSEDGTLITAVYDGNALYSVKMNEVEGEAVSVTVDVPATGTPKVKFMLWDGIRTMEPLGKKEINYRKPQNSAEETTAITLNHATYPLVVGNSSKTDFSRWEDMGSSFTLAAAVDGGNASSVTWEIEDSDIAYIRDNKTSGESISIRGKRTGVTKATATAPNGDKAECVITVIDNVTRETVQTLDFNTDKLTLAPEETAKLIPIINPKDVYSNGVLNTNLTWSSSDTSVATVSNGVITAIAAGKTTITATSADVGRTASCEVTVAADTAAQTVTADVSKAKVITVGQSARLTAEGNDITWKSDNPSVVDVDKNGVITAYSNSYVPKIGSNNQTVFENGITAYNTGMVKIYATSPTGDTKTFYVKSLDAATKANAVKVYIDNPVVVAGQTKDITAAILPAREFGKTVTWSSSDEAVATIAASGKTVYGVPKATITGVKAGTATITAECDGKTDTIEITVTGSEVKVSDIDITNVKEIDIDEVYELNAEVDADAANKELAWLSSDSSILTVNNEGVVMGYKAGTAKVYAIAMDSVTADADKTTLTGLKEEREISDISSFLSGKTYKTVDITVKGSSPYLRNLHAPEEAVTDNSVNLLWNRASLSDTGDFAAYNVYNGDTKIAESITTLGYTVNDLEPDTEYTFKVEAVTASGASLAEESVTVTTDKKSPVINVVTSYGAKGDGVHMDTLAIQKAIDDCPKGGTVYLPEGYVFLSGALYLKSDMNFKVDGILLGSPYDKDYPATITRWEGWRRLYQTAAEWGANSGTDGLTENVHPHASLINAGTYDEGTASHTGAYNIENLTICGKGQINANGFRLGYNEGLNQKSTNGGQPEPMTPAMNQTVRGRAITLHNADKVYIKDVTVSYSPSWTIHPIFCRNLTVDGIDVVSKGDGTTGAADNICILNGDGIDPDSSTMVNLFNMDFRTGDDGVAIKTGKDKEGNTLDKPCAYIRITDCYSHDSKGGIVLGSENASGTHDTLIQNLKVGSTTLGHTIWFKGAWSRGGVTHNLLIRDIDGVDKFDIQTTYNTPTNNPADTVPSYKYITFENCTPKFLMRGYSGGTYTVNGETIQRSPVYLQNFTFRGCTGTSSAMDYCKDFTIWDAANESAWSKGSNTENIVFAYSDIDTNTKLKITDTATHVSSVDNDKHTIITATGTTEEQLLADLVSSVNANINKALSSDGKTLTITAEDGTTTQDYTVSYATIWDFAEYTTEVKLTADGVAAADYNGLEIALAGNGNDSDHDKITTAGVYWRGGASSGTSARYIKYTPTQNGTLTVTGKLNGSGGRLGISMSLDVSSLAADSSSTTSTSEATFQMTCTANTTYYIIPKSKSATVTSIAFVPEG